MRFNVGNLASYKGRIISTLFVISILLFIREMVRIHYEEVPHPIPIPALIPIIIAWYLGKQFDNYVHLSTRDSLTGLYNRRYTINKFPNLAKSADKKKSNIEILLIDVNDFKVINDTYGHDFGDKVLESISNHLNASFDGKDIISRWGGDEFLIISPSVDSKLVNNKIDLFKNRIKNEDWNINGRSLSVSIGKANYPLDDSSLKNLVAKADSNMYEFKMNQKKKRVVKT